MNRNRVLLGGIAAGVLWTAIDFGIHGGLLSKTYEALVTAGIIAAPPGWFLPVLLLANLAVGITIAFLYAAVRPTLGAGPGTAIKVGVCVFIFLLPLLFSQVAFYKMGPDVNTWAFVSALAQTLAASLLAGWLYKD